MGHVAGDLGMMTRFEIGVEGNIGNTEYIANMRRNQADMMRIMLNAGCPS